MYLSWNKFKKLFSVFILLLIFKILSTNAYSLQFVTVNDTGNMPDPFTGYGAVDYVYRISKFEITNKDYAAMLNDVAKLDDPHHLYNSYMGRPKWDPLENKYVQYGGIIRKGKRNNYTYYVISGYENKPVVYVSWYDAARFANWLMTGNTESGAYDTSTFNEKPDNIKNQATHSQNALCWLPSHNEWYKAAYYNGNGDYWLYATQSNRPPSTERPPGGNNSANGEYVNPYPYISDVGAYTNSKSHYGTFDQSGNLWEWVENWESRGNRKELRGGAFFDGGKVGPIEKMDSQWIYHHDPSYGNYTLGFRIAARAISNDEIDLLVNRIQSNPPKIIKWGVFRELKRILRTWYRIMKMKWKNLRKMIKS